MRLTIIKLLIALGAVAGLTTTARAQPWDDRPNLLPETPHGIWGELALFTRDNDGLRPGLTIVSPLIHGHFGITNHLELAFDWGFAYGNDWVGDTSDSDVWGGNPFLGIRYVNQWRQSRLRIGGGLALPTAGGGAPYGAFVRGMWDPWLWAHDQLSLVAPQVMFEHHGRILYFMVEGSLGLMIYTGDRDPVDDVELVTQGGVEIGVRFAERFIVGGRFQAVWSLTEGGDNAQAAMAPFFQVEFGRAFLFTRLLMNLDAPLGFAFDRNGVWSFQLGGGGRF